MRLRNFVHKASVLKISKQWPFYTTGFHRKELKERLYQETDPRVTLSFYKYFTIRDPEHFRDELYVLFSGWKVFGRIYVAREGVNAQISIPAAGFEVFKTYMETSPDFTGTQAEYCG